MKAQHAASQLVRSLMTRAVDAALKEQGLWDLRTRLEAIEPDISEQYSTVRVEGDYLRSKVYAQHAFQISMALKALDLLGPDGPVTLVDVGDSCGTHIRYLQALLADGPDRQLRTASVNLDPQATERIRGRGLEAHTIRAERLHEIGLRADVMLSFQMLEHLMNPAGFLKSLSASPGLRAFVATVPYVRTSRVGLHHVRKGDADVVRTAENTHIFELCPRDWTLLARFSGWKVLDEAIYLQYPRRTPYVVTRPLWKTRDFEGFYGMILQPDTTWSSTYTDWE